MQNIAFSAGRAIELIGADRVDARSDIYSLGAVGYFLLTGVPPFVRATAAETAEAHLRANVIPPDEIQPDVHLERRSKGVAKSLYRAHELRPRGIVSKGMADFQVREVLLHHDRIRPEAVLHLLER